MSNTLAMDSPTLALRRSLATIALRRLHGRLVGAKTDPDHCFLDDYRGAACDILERAVSSALLVLDVALHDQADWNRISQELPRDSGDGFLSQVQQLRATLLEAGLREEAVSLALNDLRLGRAVGCVEPNEDELFGASFARTERPSARRDDLDAQVLHALAETLRQGGHAGLAQLLTLRLPHGGLLLVELVDYFFCRALQADPILGGELVFVYLEPVDELWKDDLAAVARAIEEHPDKMEALQDSESSRPTATAESHAEEAFELLFQQGLDCYLAGDYEKAVAHFTAALRFDSECLPLYSYRGDAYRLLSDYDRAIADYSAALRLNPGSAAILVQRANAHRLQGDTRQAVRDASAAIKLEPQLAAAYLNRADAYAALALNKQAIADYTRAIQLKPQTLWAHFGRAKAYLQTENYDQAVADFTTVLTLNSHYVLALLHRGDARRLKGNYSQAIIDYTEVLRHHPRNPVAYRSRAQAFELKGDVTRAIADYGVVLRLNPADAVSLCNRGTLYRRKGNLNQALIDLNESVRCSRGNATAFYSRGLISLAQGLLAEALADFNAALDCNPNLIAGYLGRALVHDRQGQFGEGIQNSGRAIQLNDQGAAGYLIRGLIASHAGRYDRAVADLTRAIELDANFPAAYQERGMVYLFQEDHAQASADFSRMIELDPHQAIAYTLRGTMRQIAGDSAAALADFAQALKLDPRSILTGCHNSLSDDARSRTTQLLADYIEGICPKLPEAPADVPNPASRPRRKTIVAPPKDKTTLHTMPALVGEKIARSTDTMPAIQTLPPPEEVAPEPEAEGTPKDMEAVPEAVLEITTSDPPAEATETSEAQTDEAAATLLMIEDDPVIDTAETTATPSEAPQPPAAPAPEQPALTCLLCRKDAAPYTKLPGGRVRCGNCTAVFLPGDARPLSLRSGSPSSPALNAAKTKLTKPKKNDDDDAMQVGTRKQKLVLSLSGAGLALLFFYFYFPSFLTTGAEPPFNSIKVSADDLLRDFTVNRVSAAKKYSASPILATGEVAEIILDKRPRIRFKRLDRKGGTVEAFFSHVNELKEIQKGQPITLRGECEGWQKNVVEITLCKVVANESAAR